MGNSGLLLAPSLCGLLLGRLCLCVCCSNVLCGTRIVAAGGWLGAFLPALAAGLAVGFAVAAAVAGAFRC